MAGVSELLNDGTALGRHQGEGQGHSAYVSKRQGECLFVISEYCIWEPGLLPT